MLLSVFSKMSSFLPELRDRASAAPGPEAHLAARQRPVPGGAAPAPGRHEAHARTPHSGSAAQTGRSATPFTFPKWRVIKSHSAIYFIVIIIIIISGLGAK